MRPSNYHYLKRMWVRYAYNKKEAKRRAKLRRKKERVLLKAERKEQKQEDKQERARIKSELNDLDRFYNEIHGKYVYVESLTPVLKKRVIIAAIISSIILVITPALGIALLIIIYIWYSNYQKDHTHKESKASLDALLSKCKAAPSIINKTTDRQRFDSLLHDLKEDLEYLTHFEKYQIFLNSQPSEILESISQQSDAIEKAFNDRVAEKKRLEDSIRDNELYELNEQRKKEEIEKKEAAINAYINECLLFQHKADLREKDSPDYEEAFTVVRQK